MVDTAKSDIPRHLGLILDGNRRWATDQGLSAFEGHKRGADVLKEIVDAAFERGIQFVTAYVFSTENWQRTKAEVKFLMELLQWWVTNQVEEAHKKGIRILFMGKEAPLSQKILKSLYAAEEKTKNNTKGTLALCLNYGGQTEIAEAVQKIIKSGVKAEDVTPDTIQQNLYHPDVPDVDFIIRTSGEERLSNFMLWRAAYAELYFVADKHWPAFSVNDLDLALAEYGARVRRFGQ